MKNGFFGFLKTSFSASSVVAGVAVHAAETFFGFLKKAFSATLHAGQAAFHIAQSLGQRFVRIIGDALRIAVGAVSAVIGIGLAGAIKAQVEAAGVLQIAQASGRSVGSSIVASASLRGMGVKAGDVSGLQNDVFQQRMSGAMWGVGDYGTPEGLAQYRQRYRGLQSGGYLGRTMARNMESSMGTEALRGTAMLPDDLFNKQQQRSAGIQNALGMNPRDVERAAQNFTLLRASIEQLGSTVLTRIGTEVLPYLIKVTDKAVDAIVANGDRIAQGIHNGVGVGIRALANFGIFLVRDLPQMLFAGAKFLLRGVATIADVAPLLGRSIMRIADIAKGAVGAVWHGIQQLWQMAKARFQQFMANPLVAGAIGSANTRNKISTAAASLATKAGADKDTANILGYLAPTALAAGAIGLGKVGLRFAGRALIGAVGRGAAGVATAAGEAAVGAGGTAATGTLAAGAAPFLAAAAPYIAPFLVVPGAYKYYNWQDNKHNERFRGSVNQRLWETSQMKPGRARREFLARGGRQPEHIKGKGDAFSDMFAAGDNAFRDIGGELGGVFRHGKEAWSGEYSREPNQVRDAALQAIAKLDKMQGGYNPDKAVKFLEEIKNMTGENLRKATQIEKNTSKTADGLGNFGQNLIAETLNYRTELDYGALRRG